VVLFDQGHLNYHRIDGSYAAFGRILAAANWEVQATSQLDLALLRRGRVLVIVSALASANYPNNWRLPTPSAFSSDEINTVRQWVEEGGGLLLITDHMPFAGAAADLAAAFGARFSNGFAFDEKQLVFPKRCLNPSEVHVFSRSDGSLASHVVTTGVDLVATFTGSAFEFDGTPLMTFSSTSVSLEPDSAWNFASTPRRPVAGWQQGGVKVVGLGRVAVFGEAAMFTEQNCSAGEAMGMNHPVARHNARLAQNVIDWLGGRTVP